MAVSVVIVAFNTGRALVRCLDSLEGEPELEILMVNNGEDTPEIEETRRRASVRLLSPGDNVGFATACNLGAGEATGEVLLFLNPDTIVQPGAIAALASTLEDESVGIVMGRLLLLHEPDRLNSAGAAIHITGMGWSSGFREPAETLTETREITYANGSVLAIRRDLFHRLGGFTDEFFAYHEDLELGWRARMAGLRILLNPRADVLHEYEQARNPTKNYLMERNRLIFVATAYSLRLLLVLAPVLLLAELGLVGVALKDGWARDKLRGWRWCLRHRRWVLEHRRALQTARRVGDRELARFLTPEINPGMISVPKFVRATNPLLKGYWALARRLL